MSDPTNHRERPLLERLEGFQWDDRMLSALMENSEIARQFYRAFLPPGVVEVLEDVDPVPLPGKFLNKMLRESRCDVAHLIPLKSGKIPRIYGLIEHKSRSDRRTAYQVDKYIHGIWQRDENNHKTTEGLWLPPHVYCFVLHNGKGRWTAPRSVEAYVNLVHARVLAQPAPDTSRYRLIDVCRFDVDKVRHFPALTASLMVMICPPFDELLPYLRHIPDVGELHDQISWFLWHKYDVIDMETAERIASALRPEQKGLEKDMENSFAYRLHAEGRTEGIATGRAEGIAEGETRGIATGRAEGIATGRAEGIAEGETRGRAEILVHQLEHKFGDLSEAVRNLVSTASLEQLERWGIGLLSAETVDELFGEMKTA